MRRAPLRPSDDGGARIVSLIDAHTGENFEAFRSAVGTQEVQQSCIDLALSGKSRSVGAWMVSRVFDGFARHSLAAFWARIDAEPEAALADLSTDCDVVCSALARVAEPLQTPSLVPSFQASVRAAIVEPAPVDTQGHGSDDDDADDVLSSFDRHSSAVAATGNLLDTRQPVLRFLVAHARLLLRTLESTRSSAAAARDPTLPALQRLGVARLPAVRKLWAAVAEEVTNARVADAENDGASSGTSELLDWKARVIDVFGDVVTGGVGGAYDTRTSSAADREFRDEWSAYFTDRVLQGLGEARIANFFDLAVEFPDSRPALAGLAYCIRRVPALHHKLIADARRTLERRLHHAGTRTEDVLSVLAQCIKALSCLFPRGEAGAAVSEVCGPTLNHLRRRRDAVAALVADMAKPPGSEGAHVLQYHAADDDDVADAEGVSPQRGGGGGNFGGHADVLRVLLSALSLQAVVREYRNVLARTLLSPNPDVDAASEVLERMKCIFGEEALCQCVVMLRDVTISRRTNVWMDERWRSDQRGLAPPAPSRLAILSGTCWPTALVKRPPRGEGFEAHPTVQRAMDAMTKTFRLMKPSQNLVYLQSHGAVTLRFDQRDSRGATVSTEERLPPAVATAVLYMEEGLTTAGGVAERMKCTPAFLVAQLQPFAPRLIIVAGSGAAANVGVQHVQVAAAGCFDEAEEADSNQAPSFLSPEELQVFEKMSSAMLKTGGPKTAAQIENSIRMFGKFRGTAAQAKEVLMFLVAQNKISTPDAGATFCAVKQ